MTAAPVAPDALRATLGGLPTGVTVITTRTEHGQDARTANSFTSVSLEPALVSVCFHRDSPFTAALRATGLWAVSVLAADQRALSARFANRATVRELDGVAHTIGSRTGAALLTGAVANLECRSVTARPAGDHVLFLAEVLSLRARGNTPALVFYRGGYHAID
ncbi:flavin reductase family protein [Amycolatopsis sp. CA-230715]|uniref:flavin reductase family protein n=1 Tax=Amycolatopsis sp. CA-230715 TaxID=2745196 RepID=UPI001C014F8D|nr:flavin reductase family protein [Amycolatopsis sp. CA-230715]QWF84054.1 NADH-dependent flavin reductase [Amycolatopsis sp. CA-230715]